MDLYPLNHGGASAEMERLDFIHKKCLTSIWGRDKLPADIKAALLKKASAAAANGSPPIAVADIATGTGTWLIELAGELPPTARLDGFDFQLDKFHPKNVWPRNVQLQFGDVTVEPPEELHGQYDVVHIRLLGLAMTEELWATAAKYVFMLLRPGGWVLWEDIEWCAAQVTPATSRMAAIFNQTIQFHASRSNYKKLPNGLDEVLQTTGFTKTAQKRCAFSDITDPIDAKNLQYGHLFTSTSFMKGMVAAGGYGDIQTLEDVDRLAAIMEREIEQEASMADYVFWWTTGQKPE